MPELPEVETIARTLAPQVEGRRIVACELLNPSTFEGTIPLGKVVGGIIGRPGRRGKLLLLPLAFGSEPLPPVDEACPSGSLARCLACGDERITGLGFHLKMTGRLFVYPAGTHPEKHTRLLFDLDDGSRLFFDDARKFGYVRVLSPSSVACWPFWNGLGPEPLEMDADAFAAFKETGIFNKKTANAFRKMLQSGGTVDPMELYMEFRGKKPTIDALLERDGIKK